MNGEGYSIKAYTDKRALYESLKIAVGLQKLSTRGVELLSPGQVRTAIGPDAKGLTNTLVRNMQRKLVREMERAESQSAADWVISRIFTQYPNAEVGVKRGRVLQIWFDGVPVEAI